MIGVDGGAAWMIAVVNGRDKSVESPRRHRRDLGGVVVEEVPDAEAAGTAGLCASTFRPIVLRNAQRRRIRPFMKIGVVYESDFSPLLWNKWVLTNENYPVHHLILPRIP